MDIFVICLEFRFDFKAFLIGDRDWVCLVSEGCDLDGISVDLVYIMREWESIEEEDDGKFKERWHIF